MMKAVEEEIVKSFFDRKVQERVLHELVSPNVSCVPGGIF